MELKVDGLDISNIIEVVLAFFVELLAKFGIAL